MTKKEAKQYLRNQINFSLKTQDDKYFNLYYNNQYLRALKFSKIIGKPVHNENFKGGEKLFGFNTKTKEFVCYNEISDYLVENYSNVYLEINNIMEEVLEEYKEYKGYTYI